MVVELNDGFRSSPPPLLLGLSHITIIINSSSFCECNISRPVNGEQLQFSKINQTCSDSYIVNITVDIEVGGSTSEVNGKLCDETNSKNENETGDGKEAGDEKEVGEEEEEKEEVDPDALTKHQVSVQQ